MKNFIELEIIKNDLLKSISEKYNINYNELILELNSITKIKTKNSKYSCNHNFFSHDNEQSFYWAGFIAADGCAYKRGESKTLNLSLSEKDLSHLMRFKSDLNFDGPIHESITRHSLTNPKWNDSKKRSISISSGQIFEDLKRFNINPNKTKVYCFPNWIINHELVNHFMRGYIDGDGSYFFDKQRNRVCFELRGTHEFLSDFKYVLEKNVIMNSKISITTPDSTSKIKYYSKKSVPAIVKFIYKDATILLLRKYDIAKKSLEIDNV